MKTATIEKKKTEKCNYVIQFPESYPLTKEKLEELQNCNPDLQLEIMDNNHLDVIENTFLFEDHHSLKRFTSLKKTLPVIALKVFMKHLTSYFAVNTTHS